MIKTLTRQYRKTPTLGKLLFGVFLLLGVFAATFRFLHAEGIPFENSLPTMFSRLNSGYYSNTHFKFGGNDFVGIIFRQSPETLSTPQQITIQSGATAIECTGHLRGIYYNNQRGRRIWPLDTGNLAILSGVGSGYETMTVTNGFYTSCTGVSGGYIPLANEVYGQIDHTLGSQTFHMFAGLTYDYTTNTILSGTSFDHTLRIQTGGVHTGNMFDTYGGISALDMNVPRCTNFTSSPTYPPAINLPQGSDMTFLCYGSQVSGYILRVFLSGGSSPIYQNVVNTNATSNMRMTGASLATGDYFATCTVLGPSGMGPQCGNNIPFHMGGTGTTPPPGGTGCNPNFQGEITFIPSFGSIVINQSLGTYFTNKTGIILQLGATEPTHFFISGNFVESPFSGNYIGTGIFNYAMAPITLITTNGWNNFSSTFTTGTCTYTDAAKRVYVDTIPPTAPTIIAPANGTYNCPSTPLTITRSSSYDSGAGLSHYKYEIYNNIGLVTGMILSGTVPNTVTSISLNISLLPLGTYYLKLSAVDNVGIVSQGDSLGGVTGSSVTNFSFTTSQQYCTARTGVMILSPTIRLRNVDLDKVYRSDPIYIVGLTGPTLVTISKGVLFINNGTGIGTSGYVTSNDTLYIELISSNKYDTTVSANLTILGLTGTFSVTTKKSNCILSAGEKLVIQNIYENLKDEYDNDISKLADFLNTFQSMVEDETDLTNSCTLEYLLQLIEDDLGFEGGIDTSEHTAPNCKAYSIGYDAAQRAYYAPEMTNRYYFVNRGSLIRHIDYYNPGDCHINTYGSDFRTDDTSNPMRHIAPNGKIYHFIGQYGGFSATEFSSPKYFDSLESIGRYVDLRNPPKEIRTHTVDTAFTPITYAAPNGREYRIFKTDRGYMSYKLMKMKYYETLSELKHYIDRNNPSRY